MAVQGGYEDKVDVVAEVLAADVLRRTAWVRVDDKIRLRIPFSPEQERTVTQALRDRGDTRLRIRGWGEFSAKGRLRQVSTVDDLRLQPADTPGPDASARPIEEVLQEIAATVPQEEWDKLPADLSDQIDHYVYGTPKR
jgi:hypothetical protein